MPGGIPPIPGGIPPIPPGGIPGGIASPDPFVAMTSSIRKINSEASDADLIACTLTRRGSVKSYISASTGVGCI
jgi:hypothetical protein